MIINNFNCETNSKCHHRNRACLRRHMYQYSYLFKYLTFSNILPFQINILTFAKIENFLCLQRSFVQSVGVDVQNCSCERSLISFGEGRGFGRLRPNPSLQTHLFAFSYNGGVSSHEDSDKKYILLFGSYQVSGEVRSTCVSLTITFSAQPISYHNHHSLTQPYCNFLPFPLILCPNEICLIVAFTFILLTCNNTIRSVLLKARKNN